MLPRLGGSYNTIIQKNTCALDNILTILSIFKENITKSYPVIGITSTKAKFYPFMSLLSEYDFDQLRNIIAKEIGLQTTRAIQRNLRLSRLRSLIKYLKAINLCNDKYNSTFHCHLCEMNFKCKCKIGSIGCIITNLEYSICAKPLTSRC